MRACQTARTTPHRYVHAQRPFWKRKRWIAAAVLWLVVAYPLSAGPAAYFLGRGWITNAIYHVSYSPLIEAERTLWQSHTDTLWDRYCTYFYEHGRQHAPRQTTSQKARITLE